MPGRPGGELRDAATELPRSFNPYVDSRLVSLLHASLLEVNPLTLEIEPALAESFTVSEDRTQITLTLREGVRWSDGEPSWAGCRSGSPSWNHARASSIRMG
jgi:peptide/nickel transport system substrate-binding protein